MSSCTRKVQPRWSNDRGYTFAAWTKGEARALWKRAHGAKRCPVGMRWRRVAE